MHGLAHRCTQFDAFPFIPIDAGLDYTCFEVSPSIYKATVIVSLTSTRVA